MKQIAYRTGCHYQLVDDYLLEIPILPDQDISIRFVKLTKQGLLTIRTDYAWDGPSGPTTDSKCAMRASLVHDAIYALLRDGNLDAANRGVADLIFKSILLEDGMSPIRAEFWYQAVAQFGQPYMDPGAEKPVMVAP